MTDEAAKLNTDMAEAARAGNTEAVRLLLTRCRDRIDIHHQEDYALRWACENGHLDTVALLLEHGADPFGGVLLQQEGDDVGSAFVGCPAQGV